MLCLTEVVSNNRILAIQTNSNVVDGHSRSFWQPNVYSQFLTEEQQIQVQCSHVPVIETDHLTS